MHTTQVLSAPPSCSSPVSECAATRLAHWRGLKTAAMVEENEARREGRGEAEAGSEGEGVEKATPVDFVEVDE